MKRSEKVDLILDLIEDAVLDEISSTSHSYSIEREVDRGLYPSITIRILSLPNRNALAQRKVKKSVVRRIS